MASAPRVSVVMPVYNREDLVGRAIGSILGQDFTDFEIIVVDDGSTDRTVEVVRSFADPRIRFHALPANCGISMARNLGFRLAAGEFLAMMDSDDVSLPSRLGRQVEWLAANPDVDILGCHAVVVSGEERKVAAHAPDDAVIKARLLNLNGSAVFDPTLMIRASFLAKSGVVYPIMRTDLDHGLFIDAMVKGARFAVLQEYLFDYYRHPGNITAEAGEDHADHLRRKTPMRARVLGLFFPGLTHEEATAIAVWMEEGRKPSIIDACMALAAIRKASADNKSYWGESKAEVGQILRRHAARALKALSREE